MQHHEGSQTDGLTQLSTAPDQGLALGSAAVAAAAALVAAVGSSASVLRITEEGVTPPDNQPELLPAGLLVAVVFVLLAVGLSKPAWRLVSAMVILSMGLLHGGLLITYLGSDKGLPPGSYALGLGGIAILLDALLACTAGLGGFAAAAWAQNRAVMRSASSEPVDF